MRGGNIVGFHNDYYKGRRVLVTGCTSGIGAAVARHLFSEKAHVIGIDRHEPHEGVNEFLQTDLGDPASIAKTIDGVKGPIGSVFNCAGLSGGAADPTTVLRVNFMGLRALTEGVLPHMSRGAAIANTSSAGGAGYMSNLDQLLLLVRTDGFDDAMEWCQENNAYIADKGGYRVSKEAIIVYTLDRCIDLAQRGIRINSIGPGITDTPMLADSVRVYGEQYLENVPKPLGRISTAEEQANILLFLNSDEASYVNGQHIWSDGGLLSGKIVGRVQWQ